MNSPDQRIFKGLYADYEIDDILKSGKLATIWRGTNLKTQEKVAIKFYHSMKWENPKRLKKKLFKEGLTMKVLEHVLIGKVLDFFHTDEGSNGLVMEYLDGMDLNEFIHKRHNEPIPLYSALKIIREVGLALDYAHNLAQKNPERAARNYHKVLHQDIKPANIFITSSNEVKLIDFGISRIDSEHTELSHMGYGFTRTYAAPDLWDESEQFLGDKYTEGHDLYSLGLVFYELITGKAAFKSLHQARVGKMKSLNHFGVFPKAVLEMFSRWTNIDPEKRFNTSTELDIELSKLMSMVEESPWDMKAALAEVKENSFKSAEDTMVDTMKSSFQNGQVSADQKNFINICLKAHFLQIEENNTNPHSLLAEIKSFSVGQEIPIRETFKIDDVTFKNLYDNFLKVFPTDKKMDFADFKDILENTDRLANILSRSFRKSDCYGLYSESLSHLNKLDMPVESKANILFNLRNGLNLDPFECDGHVDTNKKIHSLTGACILRLLSKNEDQNEVHDYVSRNFKFFKTPTQHLINDLKRFMPSQYLNHKVEVDEKVKHIIYKMLAIFAAANRDVSISERKNIFQIKDKLGDKKISFGSCEKMNIQDLVKAIPNGYHSFVISNFLFMVLKKINLTEDEIQVLGSIGEALKRNDCFKQLSITDKILILEPFFDEPQKLRHQKKILSLIKPWIGIKQDDISNTIVNYNKMRFLFGEIQITHKEIADILECFEGTMRIHTTEIDSDFLLELYLFYNQKILHEKRGTVLQASQIMNHFQGTDSLEKSYFVYNLLKNYLKYRVQLGDYTSKLEIPDYAHAEIKRIMADLKIPQKVYGQALYLMKLNFNVGVVITQNTMTKVA